LRPQRQTEHARAENGVIKKKKMTESTTLGNEQGASPVDRVAIAKNKGYRDRVDFHSIHSWTVFLVAVEYFQEESPCMRRLPACVASKENRMSRKNGDRARFDRQRRAKIHNRTRIRKLWETIRAQETTSAQNVARAGKTLGSPETTKKSRIESVNRDT
jgi:hypothetical protein